MLYLEGDQSSIPSELLYTNAYLCNSKILIITIKVKHLIHMIGILQGTINSRFLENQFPMKIYIKYMVSLRCKLMVKVELNKLGLSYLTMDLGMVEMIKDITLKQHAQLKKNLLTSGLELLDNKKTILIEKIKNVVIEMIHYCETLPKVTYSEYISEKLNYDYTYLSTLFSKAKGMTIQQFIIVNKIEKVKELLLYDELSLSEISYKLHYSSVAHLSNQFKKITGFTLLNFKHLKQKRVLNLENI